LAPNPNGRSGIKHLSFAAYLPQKFKGFTFYKYNVRSVWTTFELWKACQKSTPKSNFGHFSPTLDPSNQWHEVITSPNKVQHHVLRAFQMYVVLTGAAIQVRSDDRLIARYDVH
jgi:hypothetical protein